MKRRAILFGVLMSGALGFGTFDSCVGQTEPPAVLFSRGLGPVTTGWEDEPEKLSAAYCAECHRDTHNQWQTGLHARAWVDPAFVEAARIEPREWCVHCHAPLQTQLAQHRREKTGAPAPATVRMNPRHASLLDEGINCAGCHVRNAKILATEVSGNAPHESVKTPYLKTSEFCAECHQFNFPLFRGEQVKYTSEPMQDTYAELKRSGYKRTCQTCHYEEHRLMGPHDRAWLRQHFSEFEAELSPGLISVRFDVDSFRGHNLPTGDLFKSLAFQAARDPGFQIVFFQKKWARVYGAGPLNAGTFWNRSLLANTGLRPEETRVNITFDSPPDGPVYLRLIYFTHDEHLGGKSDLTVAERQTVLWTRKLR